MTCGWCNFLNVVLYRCFASMYVYDKHDKHVVPTHGGWKRAMDPGILELPCVCWKLSPNLLEEQCNLLTTELQL